MQTIAVNKARIDREGGVVILSLKEYEQLRDAAVPTYELKGKAATALDRLVERGLKAHKAGKTKRLRSLADLD